MTCLKWMSKKVLAITAILILCLSSLSIIANADEAETYIRPAYQSYVTQISNEYCICPELVLAIIETESSGNAKAKNGDCIGLMQVSEPCHYDRMDRLGVTDLYDPYSNILVGCDYLAELFEEYEDLGTVLMVYNGSSNAINRGENANYTGYANQIMKRSYELERLHGK